MPPLTLWCSNTVFVAYTTPTREERENTMESETMPPEPKPGYGLPTTTVF